MGPEPKAFDITVFQENTPERNYWLGVLMADGCVIDNTHKSENPQIQLTMKEYDLIFLYKQFTKSEAKICKPREEVASLTIRSQPLADLLAEYHIIPRKSLREKTPEELKYDRDFWRGIIDGDGCLGINQRGFPRLELVGSKDICRGFLEFVRTISPTKVTIGRDKRTTGLHKVQLCGQWVKQIVEVLYQDAVVAIERKEQIAQRIMAIPDKRGPYRKGV